MGRNAKLKSQRKTVVLTDDPSAFPDQGAAVNFTNDYAHMLKHLWKTGAVKRPSGPLGTTYIVITPEFKRIRVPPHTPGTDTQLNWLKNYPVGIAELGVEHMVYHLKTINYPDTTIQQIVSQVSTGIQNGMSFIFVEDLNGVVRINIAPWNLSDLFKKHNIN